MSTLRLTESDPASPLKDAHSALVPSSYAEKAMASLLQLHQEVLDEKERRVELYRRLMEREQSLAELRMYVQLLEERLSHAGERIPTTPARSHLAEHDAAPAPRAAEAPRVPNVMTFTRRPYPEPPAPASTPAPAPAASHSRVAPSTAPEVKPEPAPQRRPATDGWKTW